MKIRNIELKDILSHRKEVLKPILANKSNLGRIKKIDFKGNIFITNDTVTGTDMIRIKKNDLVISGINANKGAVAVYRGEKDILASIHYSYYSFNEKEINIKTDNPEFFDWKWIKVEELTKVAVSFKSHIYSRLKSEIENYLINS